VLLLYWTAVPTPEGELRLFRDLYRRDAKVLAGLQQPFRFRSSAREAVAGRI
jgi:murein L,D-transpeptidase YcbB/YkuD